MSRIPTPSSIDAAPANARPLLEGVNKMLGSVPNLFRIVATSPAALEGYLGMFGALGKGTLPAPTRERIALAIAEYNGCSYCLSAHTYLGKNLAKLTEEEISANRHGSSSDPKAAAAVSFAVSVAHQKGRVTESEFKAVKDAGYTDEQIVEIILHVALNVFTNYLNETLQTEVDFPLVTPN